MRFELSEALQVLERTPRVLRELLAGLPDAWIGPPKARRPGRHSTLWGISSTASAPIGSRGRRSS